MAPKHDIPIEAADVWDILDWDIVAVLATRATGDPRDAHGDNALPWIAKKLIDAATKPVGRDDERLLHKVASAWIGYDSDDAVRRQRAGDLATRLGARPDRLISYVALKWGLFKSR